MYVLEVLFFFSPLFRAAGRFPSLAQKTKKVPLLRSSFSVEIQKKLQLSFVKFFSIHKPACIKNISCLSFAREHYALGCY